MAEFHTAAFPQDQYRFRIYANTEKLSGEEIQRRTGCYAWCNLGYFDMTRFLPCGGLIVDKQVIQAPEYHDWGVSIDADGRMTAACPEDATCSWCPAVPPMLKNGKRAAAARDFGKNGTTMIGFKPDGTPVVLLALKGSGSATSAEAVAELQRLGCVTVLRYDGSWSTQGDLGGGYIHPSQYRTVLSLLLIFKRENKREDSAVHENLKVMPYSLELAGGKALSKNFKVQEFRCHDGSDTVFIADELVSVLQAIREHFGKPVNINSGYRTEAWNADHGGAEHSQHKYGRAADITISGVTPAQIATFAREIMPDWGGVGIYSSQGFTHIDVREVKSDWNG
jgi:uncharacterized protein YcbK (DUF882 family)